MLIKALGGVVLILLGTSAMLGSIAPFFAARQTIWKSLGIWGLGLGAGLAGIAVSLGILYLQGKEDAALRAAG